LTVQYYSAKEPPHYCSVQDNWYSIHLHAQNDSFLDITKMTCVTDWCAGADLDCLPPSSGRQSEFPGIFICSFFLL